MCKLVDRKDMPRCIAAVRRRLEIGQTEFAELLGVSRDTVASWEQGRRAPCCQYMERAIGEVAPARKGKK